MRRTGVDDGRFVEVVSEVGPELLNYFERRVGEDAADLLAEVMTAAWRRHGDIPEEHEQARMWLFGVARNVLMNARRSRIRQFRLADALRDSISSSVRHDTVEQLEVRDAICQRRVNIDPVSSFEC
jgi:DNA-directed RNA polymerase specialized sigma24 family protein